MKVVTLAAAAELLGWDHRFETRIVSSAPLDEGVLRGDLVIIGGGDPSISERGEMPGALKAIAHRVREAGIVRIEGGVNLDRTTLSMTTASATDGLSITCHTGYARPSRARVQRRIVELVITAGANTRRIRSPFRCGRKAAGCSR
jgi:D-alanyl-D-alanine carboxypeptidase